MTKSTHQLVTLVFALGCSMFTYAHAADGSIQFSGELYTPPCKITIEPQTTLNKQFFVHVQFSGCESPVRGYWGIAGATSAPVKMRVIHSQAVVSSPVSVLRAMVVTVEYI
ncbi:hypothetical protein D3C77_151130 [compost metagenome]